MRETRNDTVLAVFLAVLVHVLPLLVLLVAAWLRTGESAAAGEPVNAEFVDLNALPSSMRSALTRPPEPLRPPPPEPEPEPEPLPEALPEEQVEPQPDPQEQLPEPDEQQQEEVRPDAQSQETREQPQDAQQRQGQVDLTDRERRQEEEQRRLTEMERERLRQLEDIRRQKAQATREAELTEERLRQLAERRAQLASNAAAANAAAGNRGADPNQLGAYKQALMEAIRSNWTRPDNILPTQRCRIVIKQIPGGEVIDAQVDPSCPYDEQGRRSIEAAVLKAQPLPYAGFERVFARTLLLDFQAQDP